MESLKGEGKPLFFFHRADGLVQLVSYPDESWGIIRSGRTVCTWESDELADCLRTFMAMARTSRSATVGRTLLAPPQPAGEGSTQPGEHGGSVQMN